MPITKDKLVKSSTRRRVGLQLLPQSSPKSPNGAHPVSTEQVAQQFCAEMIQNLKRNVPEPSTAWASCQFLEQIPP
jgi:hypothetical protein